jgi:hypothetical protein
MRPMRSRAGLVAWFLSVLVLGATSPLTAQVNMQLSGVVESVGDHELTLITPAPPRRPFGGDAKPAPPPKLLVNLQDVPASQWVFLRPGERIAVVGVPSADGTRFAAIAIIGGAGPRRDPQMP